MRDGNTSESPDDAREDSGAPRNGRRRPGTVRSFGRVGGTDLLVLSVVLLIVLGGLAGVAEAATVVVGFEEHGEGTRLTTQYEDAGVVFEAQGNGSAGAIVRTCDPQDVCPSARGGKNAVVTPGDFEPILTQALRPVRYPLVVSFTGPQESVELYVREIEGIDGRQTATLVARNAAGDVVVEDAIAFEAGTGWHRIAVSARAPTIDTVALTLGTVDGGRHNLLVVDDLTFRVNDPPRAAFDPPPYTPTAGDPVSFDASDSSDPDGEIVEYRWDFDGDGSTDGVAQTPEVDHTFDEPGTYPVALRVVDSDGATDTVTREVTVAARPVARCSVPDTEVGPGEEVRIDASASNAELVRFDVDGDGEFDRTNREEFTETVSFPDPGEATPVVRAETGRQSDTRTCPTVTVNGRPTAVISSLADPPTVDHPVTFDASESSDRDGDIVLYSWDFDEDGDPDHNGTTPRATHTFGEAGTYTVSLVVVDDDGATGRTETTVHVNAPPTAIFDGPDAATAGDPVSFDASDSSDPDGEIVEYRWDLDDGTPVRSSFTPRTVHTFREAGRYTVTLVVVDDDGATGRTETTVHVNDPPSAAFDPTPEVVPVGESVALDASASSDPDGEVVLYSWDVDGDGAPDRNTSDRRITHPLGEAGRYTVSLVVVDDDGATDRAEASVRVVQRPAPVLSGLPEDPRAEEAVTFDASGSSDPDGEIVEYRWDFDGDGTTDRNTTGPRATHVFEEPGTYDVSLAVVDDTGVVGRTRASISVRHPFPPGTDLAVGGAVGLAGALTLRWIRRPSPAPSGVPDGGNSRVDGTDPGTTEEGERRRDRSPQAVMWYWPSEPVAPCPVVFDASLSTGGADGGGLSYLWKVDDESGSRRRWDVLFFDEAGDYDVELVVRDGNGTGRVERTVAVEEREGDLDLDEVSPRGTAAGAGTPDGEYVVFRNTGNGTLDLGGWTVHDVVDGSGEEWPEEGEHVFEFPEGVELDPGETATLHTGTEPEDRNGTGIDGPERSYHLFWGERRPLWNRETDVVVVEDDGALPVMAVRYRRGDDGDHEFEDLDVEVLEDWFPTVVLSRREGVPVLRIGVGTGALLGAVSSAVGFLAGTTFLRGPWTALRNWALVVEFLSMSSATWLVATTYGGLPASVDPELAWLPPGASVGLLVAVAVALRVGPTLRDRFGSRAS